MHPVTVPFERPHARPLGMRPQHAPHWLFSVRIRLTSQTGAATKREAADAILVIPVWYYSMILSSLGGDLRHRGGARFPVPGVRPTWPLWARHSPAGRTLWTLARRPIDWSFAVPRFRSSFLMGPSLAGAASPACYFFAFKWA